MSYGSVNLRTGGTSPSFARMMRRHIRTVATAPLYHLGLWRLHRAFRRRVLGKNEVCILGLHRVLSEGELPRSNSFPGLIIRERTFSELLKYLRDSFQVLSLGAFLDASRTCAASTKAACVITFDDGWKDNYTTAFPLLKKHDIPATIFLVTNLVENGARFWVEQVNEAWKDPASRRLIREGVGRTAQSMGNKAEQVGVVEYLKHMSMAERMRLLETLLADEAGRQEDVDRNMTWDQAAEMSRNGIEFGGHTVNHPLLTFEDDETVARELQIAKRTIEAKLGVKARAFCYPNGDWNDRVRKKVAEAGYECAFSVRTGWHCQGDDLFSIRRILIHEGNLTNRRGEFSPAVFNMTLGRGW